MDKRKDSENLLEIEKALDRENVTDTSDMDEDTFPDIFISYSRSDWKSHVKPLGQLLFDSGFNVWIDQHIIRSGDDWLDKINEALDRCKVLILCVSSSALNSRYVKMEYRYFLDEDKPVIPVIVEETKLTAELRGIQYIQYDESDDLIDEIQRRLNNQ